MASWTHRRSRKQFRRWAQSYAPTLTPYQIDLAGQYRVADTSLELYELYVGDGAAPDLSAAPAATSTSLPLSYALTPPGAGTKTYHVLCLTRNRYNLRALARGPVRTITIDSAGALVLADPSAPESVTLEQGHDGYALLGALYNYEDDGDAKADTWQIYATTTGVDPNPATDTPTEVTMRQVGPAALLRYELGPYTSSQDLRVLLRAKRSSDGATCGTVTVQQLTTAAAPSTPVGSIFGGTQYVVAERPAVLVDDDGNILVDDEGNYLVW